MQIQRAKLAKIVIAALLLIAGWQSWRFRDQAMDAPNAVPGMSREETVSAWNEFRSESPAFALRYPVHLTPRAENQRTGGIKVELLDGDRVSYTIEIFPARGVSAPNLLEAVPGSDKKIEKVEVGVLDGRLMTYQSTDGKMRAALAAARSDWAILAVDQDHDAEHEAEFETMLWSLRLSESETFPAVNE